MSREGAVLVMAGVAVLLLVGMFFAWRRRTRRDATLTAPLGEPAPETITSIHEILYVATTAHNAPLERLAFLPLAFRARGVLALTAHGIQLQLDGSPSVFIPSSSLRSAGVATVAIDRVVEKNGLIRIVWAVTDGTVVDSYFRPTTQSPQSVLPLITSLITTAETGAAA